MMKNRSHLIKNPVRKENLLTKLYFDPKLPSSFGGKNKLKKAVKNKIDSKFISKWVKKIDTYTLHKQVKRKFLRRKYIVSGLNSLWQIDLTELPQLAKYNQGFRFILFVIDCFSRKAYAIPLKTKSGIEVSEGIENVIAANDEIPPDQIMTDKGKEFFNSHFKNLLKKYNINHYTSNNQEIKASMVERLQRTIKSKLFRYFTHTNSYNYVDALQDIITSYNNSVHAAHDMPPNKVNYKNQEDVWQMLYNQKDIDYYHPKPKFKLHDKVRISKYSSVFQKSYLPLWSSEVFTISKVHKTSPPVYSLKDYAMEELDGTWYEEELQKIDVKDKIYKVDSVLGQRKINGKTEYLVRWVGYPPSFDSYVNKSDLLLNYKN